MQLSEKIEVVASGESDERTRVDGDRFTIMRRANESNAGRQRPSEPATGLKFLSNTTTAEPNPPAC